MSMEFDRTSEVYNELERLRDTYNDDELLAMVLAVLESNTALNALKKANIMLGDYHRNMGA